MEKVQLPQARPVSLRAPMSSSSSAATVSSGLTYEEEVAQQLLQWAREDMPSFKVSDAKDKFMKINIPILQAACAVLVERGKLVSSAGRIPVFNVVEQRPSAPKQLALKTDKTVEPVAKKTQRIAVTPKLLSAEQPRGDSKPRKTVETDKAKVETREKKRTFEEVEDSENAENVPCKMNIIDLNINVPALKKQTAQPTSKGLDQPAFPSKSATESVVSDAVSAREAQLRQLIADEFVAQDDMISLPSLLASSTSTFSVSGTFVHEVLVRMASENKLMVDGDCVYRI